MVAQRIRVIQSVDVSRLRCLGGCEFGPPSPRRVDIGSDATEARDPTPTMLFGIAETPETRRAVRAQLVFYFQIVGHMTAIFHAASCGPEGFYKFESYQDHMND